MIDRVLLSSFTSALFLSGKNTTEVKTELRKHSFPEDLIDDAIKEHIANLAKEAKDTILKDPKHDFKDWFTGPNNSANSHWRKLQNILLTEKQWDEHMVEDLNQSSNLVLTKLACPLASEKQNTKGLVLGYVQSGKTANFSAVISKALDAGYKFIIVLSGVHNNLRYQTEVRLRKEIINPSELDADTVTKMDPNGDFDGSIAQSANKILGHKHGFGIAVLKKNSSVLRKFNKWLDEARKEIVDNCPVLLIDDECDQASINTHNKPEEKATAINMQIRAILEHFKISSYIGYTATPFANIFIDPTIEDDLYPKDFIIALKKPMSYVGVDDLFGTQDNDGNIIGGLPIVRTINELDDTNYEDQDQDPDQIPQSLIKALDTFIVSGAVRLSRGQYDKHISMLIHCSHLKDDHRSIYESVKDYIHMTKTELNFGSDKITSLMKIFKEDISPISAKFSIEDKISDVEFEKLVKNFIGSLQIIKDNSESTERLSFNEKFWGIVIGGNTLSRGLTIEGLTTSYFMRSSKLQDTLMQMGRWFGYRPNYKDLQRIFITEEIRDKFFEMSITENELREEIETMAHNEETPLDFKLKVRQHPGMTLTARNKMRNAETMHASFSGRRALPDFLNIHDDKISLNNLKAADHLLSSIKQSKIQNCAKKFSMFRSSYLYRDCSKEMIMQFLDAYHFSPANSRANKRDIIEYLLKTPELTNWSVAMFSLINGNDKFKFDSGEEVNLLDRSYAEGFKKVEDPNAFYLRGLYLPKDEMIDLADLYDTDDVVKALKNNNEKELGCAKVRTTIRPNNRPLLALYPLSTSSKSEARESGPYKLSPLKTTHVQIGLMIVFPENKRFVGGSYAANRKI